jgi:predicted glycosyltransferase involved in capsule biosynthesis
MATALSVLIPLRTDDFAFYRARLALRAALNLADVETIVVDDGSPQSVAAEISGFCATQGFQYLRLATGDQPFSFARSRNAGLRAASSPSVYMDDADLIYRRDFFQAVVAQLNGLAQTPFSFLSMPAVYLTAGASAKVFADACLDASYLQVVHALLLEDPKGSPANAVVESYAPASGVIALSRELALRTGGYDESFSGWGGEDRDFIFRLLCANEQMSLPASFNETKSWNLNDTLAFEGWRALHRLHGEFMARQGLYAVHLHHKKLPWRGPVSSGRNMRLAAEKALSMQVANLPMAGRMDLRHSVLFDVYRAHDLLGATGSPGALMERLNAANRLKARTQGHVRPWHKKLQKLLVSPLGFFADSRYGLLRALARLFRK